jgi:hypothetical protein
MVVPSLIGYVQSRPAVPGLSLAKSIILPLLGSICGFRIVQPTLRARDQYAIQLSCSDATFQSSALVWVGSGPEEAGGVNCETTSWT